MPESSLERQLLVFVTPSFLTFILPDESSHKQVLTLYNPYEFPINYRLLSNARSKYYIPDPSGCLNPRNKVDIVIRHIDPTLRNVGANDKLRVEIFEKGKKKVLGKRDIDILLLNEIPEDKFLEEKHNFEELPQRRRHRSSAPPIQQNFGQRQGREDSDWLSLLFALLAIGICILLTPTEGSKEPTWIPTILHFNVQFKMMVCFVCGLVCHAIYSSPRQGGYQ